jgi:ATP-dependent Clp protease ATP-binding subunit ClpA
MSLPVRPFLTTRARAVFSFAHDLADRLGHDDVTPVHVTIGLLNEGRNIAGQLILYGRGLPRDVLERELGAHLPPAAAPRPSAPSRAWSPIDERMIEAAAAEARELGAEYFGCEHLLLAFLRDADGAPARVLARHGVGYADVRGELLRLRESGPEQLGGPQ